MSALRNGYRLSSGLSRLLCFSATLFLLFLIASAYCETSAGQEGEVIIIRGFGGHWPNAAKLQQRLAERGFRTRVIWCHQRTSLFKHLRRKSEDGEDVRPAAVIGFSLGASNAQLLAFDLQTLGIQVPLLVLIDGPILEAVPANVGYCVHLHRPNLAESCLPKSIVGCRFIPEGNTILHLTRGCEIKPLNSNTQVVNYQLARQGDWPSFLYDNHLTLCGGEKFQESLVRLVTALSNQE